MDGSFRKRGVIQKLKNFLGFYKTTLLRRLLPGWRKTEGGEHEMIFWEGWISARAAQPDDDFRFRVNPARPLKDVLAQLLPAHQPQPTVLDVGCGPLSNIGIRFSGGEVQLMGADLLADGYLKILARHGILPNCDLVSCAGEDLILRFGRDRFDLVCAINSLDHSRSPVEVFWNMAGVCKPGGYLHLSHYENEGITERYTGMHQWNLGMKNGRLVVDDGRQSMDFQPELCGLEMISARREPGEGRAVLEWTLRKRLA